MQNSNLKRFALALCCLAFVCAAFPAQASLTDAERKELAQSFVGRLKSLYSKKSDSRPLATKGAQEAANPKAADMADSMATLNFIPDGEELLLRPQVGREFLFADNVPALKERGRIYLAFGDFIDILFFPIDYEDDTYKAQGWYLREDWNFSLDYESRMVVTRGETLPIGDEDSYMLDEELYVSTEALARWFNIGVTPNLTNLTIELESQYPFPAVAALTREELAKRRRDYNNMPVNPLVETDYKWFDINSAQVSSSNTFRDRPDREDIRSHSLNVATQGQVLKHNYYSNVNMDNREGLNSITGRLYREEHDPVLLGGLKARAYYVGDVEQTDIPLTPSSGQEFGFNVTNNPLDYINFTQTRIGGNAIPGWDVELYRNGSLLGLITVDASGRYDFEDVDLFAGDNEFELLFFGPQGEIRREILDIPVSAEVLASQGNVYEVAATLSDEQTYRKENNNDDLDKGSPHLAARYNFFTGNVLNFVGLRSQSLEGERKLYGVGGFTTMWLKSLIDGSFAIDEEGEMRAGLQARRRFDDLDVTAGVEVGTDRYDTVGTSDPNVFDAHLGLKKALPFLPGRRNSILADLEYTESASGLGAENHSVSLASQYGSVNVSNAVNYRRSDSTLGADNKDVNLVTNVRSRLGSNKLFWRAQSIYEIEPQKELDEVLLELKYKHNKEWSGDFSVEHEPPEDFTEYRIGANWNHDDFILTPFVEYDTDNELYTGVNLRFSVIKPEEGFVPEFTSRSVIGQGFVSAFVFLDKNGDLVYNGADEPLPNVKVKSQNIVRYAMTNEEGIGLIQPLPANMRTDIGLDTETLPEPFMISKYEPRSVSPKPGETVRINMPIQYAGEIDGTVYLRRDSGESAPMDRVFVNLLPLENDVNKTMDSQSLYEGLFVFSLIPPGRYFLVADEASAKKENAARSIPRMITIGYDAPVIYAQDMTLTQGAKDVDFGVISEEEAFNIGLAPVADRRAAQPYYFISIGKKESSRLLSALYNLGARRKAAHHVADLRSIETMDETGKEKITRYFAPGNSMEQAYARCARITNSGMSCRVEAALPPSENFATRKRGIITAERDASAPAQKLLASNL